VAVNTFIQLRYNVRWYKGVGRFGCCCWQHAIAQAWEGQSRRAVGGRPGVLQPLAVRQAALPQPTSRCAGATGTGRAGGVVYTRRTSRNQTKSVSTYDAGVAAPLPSSLRR